MGEGCGGRGGLAGGPALTVLGSPVPGRTQGALQVRGNICRWRTSSEATVYCSDRRRTFLLEDVGG